MSLLFVLKKGNKIFHLVGGIAEDLAELDRGGSNGLAVGANCDMDLHHHFCVVEEFKEVVFKLHLEEVFFIFFYILEEILLNNIWITALQTTTSKLMMG